MFFKIKNLFALFLIFSTTLLFSSIAFAGEYKAGEKTIHYKGLVPCGKSRAAPGEDQEVTMPCQFCHFFVMLKGILDFVLEMVFIVAVLMIVISGIIFIFGSALPEKMSPATISMAKDILLNVVLGLVIIFGAWVFANTFFLLIGVADWTGLRGGWFKIDCPIELPEEPESPEGYISPVFGFSNDKEKSLMIIIGALYLLLISV